MANPEHLKILKQGVEVWNRWRAENPETKPDLSRAALIDVEIPGANLQGTNLQATDLTAADLEATSFLGADLRNADLYGASLVGADFQGAYLRETDLRGTDLSEANLQQADLQKVSFKRCSLGGVNLEDAKLVGAELRGANLEFARLGTLRGADLAGANLSNSVCLLDRVHLGSNKKVIANGSLSDPEVYWARVHIGDVSDFDYDHDPDDESYWVTPHVIGETVHQALLRQLVDQEVGVETIQPKFHSCFISYCHVDKTFARDLCEQLQVRGILCWLDEHDLKPGDRISDEVDEAIRRRDKTLLCCSKASLNSWWVKDEIRKAQERERDEGRDIIIPLMVDRYLLDGWKDGLASDLRSRLAADFTGWEHDNVKFEAQFERVVKALRTDEGAREAPPESEL